jgi:hypothetical protein
MDYRSTSFWTRNEDGDREVQLEMRRTLFDWILRRPARTRVFVQGWPATVWWYKGTGKRAGTFWEFECQQVIEQHRQLEAKVDAMFSSQDGPDG